MEFEHVVVDDDPPATELDVCLPVDRIGDGRHDVVGKPYHPENRVDAPIRID